VTLPFTARAEFTFDADVPLDPKVEVTIARAQEWLARSQQQNGSWGGCNGRNALAIMALMVNGTTPGHGKYGARVATGIDFLINSQHENGYLVVGSSGNMYQHALATLCLAEAHGMTHNLAIREALIKAVDLIVKAQAPSGGWRYKPVPEDADLSVTVMQIMALRACVETGVFVPKETVDLGIKFVKNVWNSKTSSFGYSTRDDGNFNRAAAGTVSLQSCNLHSDPIVPHAVAYMMKNVSYSSASESKFWYGHYYASVALYHYGGTAWKSYYPKICAKVMKDWEAGGHYRDALDTAWAILVLGVPYRYLPIYQR
jgi:squalene cyclase